MTLVASVSPFGCPLMLGDILISGQSDPQTKAVLPTIGNFSLLENSAVDLSRVAWLAQKICVITENLAVGWAGCYEPARRIISSMRAYPWSNHVTLDDVQQCLATTEYDDQSAVSLVGIFAHEGGFGEFGLNATKVNLPIFNQCRIIGNGSSTFLETLRHIGDLHMQKNDAEATTHPSWPQAAVVTLAASATLIGEEMNNYGGLEKGFGGMFEVLAFRSGKFTKLDDILYCFWAILDHNKDTIELAPHSTFVKAKYQGDILVVRRSDFVHNQQMANDEFVIGPMARAVTAAELQLIRTPDLNSVYDCHYLAVRSGDAYEVLSIVNLFARGAMVRFEASGNGTVSFSVKGKLLRYMHNRVVERFYGQSS